MKYIITFLIMIILATPLYAKVLQGSVTENWTVDKAKTEAFTGIEFLKDLSWAGSRDPNFEANSKAKEEKINRINNRLLTVFSSSVLGEFAYSVSIDNTGHIYYYSPDGELIQIGYKEGTGYPAKLYKYEYPSGELVAIILDVAENESYVFTAKGELKGHWIADKCYDANGKLVINRDIKKF